MAEKKRRGEEPADDKVGETLDDAVEADETADDAVEADETAGRSGGTATRTRAKTDGRPAKKKDTDRVGVFGRIGRFFREVVAELRKVIWPTRKELLTYAAVVIVFVAVMVTIVAGLDFVFAKGALLVFGNSE